MKIFDDFIKIIILVVALSVSEFFIENWIVSQAYTLYATTAGIFLFLLIAYTLFKEINI